MQKRLKEKHGAGKTELGTTTFSIAAPVPATLSVTQTKVSRGGDRYSEIGLVLSAR